MKEVPEELEVWLDLLEWKERGEDQEEMERGDFLDHLVLKENQDCKVFQV